MPSIIVPGQAQVSLSVLTEEQMIGTFSIERNYFSFYYCITSLLRGDKNYKFTKLLFKKFCGITCIKVKFSVTSTAKKWIFPLKISSVNVTKSGGNSGFGHIYWRNP